MTQAEIVKIVCTDPAFEPYFQLLGQLYNKYFGGQKPPDTAVKT